MTATPPIRPLSVVCAIAALPAYVISAAMFGRAMVSASFAEGAGPNAERAEVVGCRLAAAASTVLLAASVATAARWRGAGVVRLGWIAAVAVALAASVWWLFVVFAQ